MAYADFAKKYFPLPHTKRRPRKGRKKRPTISGFHVGDIVERYYGNYLRGRIQYVRGPYIGINYRGCEYFANNFRLVEAAE